MLRGWTDLGILHARSPGNFGRQLGSWRKAHPDHPITKTTLATLKSPGTELIGRIDNIAVLLPLESINAGVKRAAEAVQEGIRTMANQDRRPDKPRLRFYATNDEAKRTSQLYEQAKKDGAQFVIGPLGTEAVDILVANIEIDICQPCFSAIQTGKLMPTMLRFSSLGSPQNRRQNRQPSAPMWMGTGMR